MRDKIIRLLAGELSRHEEVLACFEGGSAAFGRADEYSDIDYQIVVRDDFAEQAAAIVEQALRRCAPIVDKYILPQPAWHGQWQCHYRLEGVSPYLLVDVLIMKESSPTYFSEPELHGDSIVHFDKTGRVGREHVDLTEQADIIRKRLERADNLCRMMHLLADKEIGRKRHVDAFELYYNLYLRTLVELLRIKYDRARWSFGPRYLSHDLPPEIYDQIRDLPYVCGPEDLLPKKDRVLHLMSELLAELKSEKGTTIDAKEAGGKAKSSPQQHTAR